MAHSRILAIGLDGLEIGVAERLMAAGDMPALERLGQRSARFLLDHGPAQFTGLAWEHVASRLSPEAGRRWAAVEFDPSTYTVWQEGARFVPWWEALDRRVVVFDAPYVDLRRAPHTRGVVGWGAHDPGTIPAGRPRELLAEFLRRFGAYPAPEWTYGTPWPSPCRTRMMGEALSHALDVRSRAARWLATERFHDWDLFIAVAGEPHGSTEGLWHGVDRDHPLHEHPSGATAARALTDVYRALDRMVGELVRAAPDASVVAFTMGGMGPNHSDVQSMVLLPELLYRHAFGRPLLEVPSAWVAVPGSVPILDERDSWGAASATWVPRPPRTADRPLVDSRLLTRRLPTPLRAVLKGMRAAGADWQSYGRPPARLDLEWQPAERYRQHWPRMPAFALPSFYDGRIRINLRGRERHGVVELSRYEETCRSLETLLRDIRNPRTGERAVDSIHRAGTRVPLALTGSEADLVVVWGGVAAALEHPQLGLIGPVPLRRTGGHTGPYGMAYIAAPGLEPGDHGVRSSFDVVPTLIRLLGGEPPPGMSGTSLLSGRTGPGWASEDRTIARAG
jgi:predicted AlkP superfamily phosphohydrolase/phosphomutase